MLRHRHRHRFVFRTDVHGCYASIDQDRLYESLESLVPEKPLLRLLWGYLHRTLRDLGFYREVTRGISLGCPLSPLMGAAYLQPLDQAMAASGLFYARFMDDWVILAPTRWNLRHAIRRVNEILACLRLQQHPDKTFIGRVSHGLDFLGHACSAQGLTLAEPTIAWYAEHVPLLYEQDAGASPHWRLHAPVGWRGPQRVGPRLRLGLSRRRPCAAR